MTVKGSTWLETAGYGWNGWTWLEWLEMAGMAINGFKLLKIAGTGWKLLETAGLAGIGRNG